MTLHVLLVEDDDDFVDELRETIAALPGDSNIRVAGSRDQAYEMLDDDFLDLVILDLKIPTVSGGLDADPEHGHAVFTRIRTVAPGTPIFVLTGSPAEDFIPALLSNQQQIDIWSEGGMTGTILFLRKLDFDQCPEKLTPVAEAIERLSDVELDRGGMNLSLAEDRLIRIFARKFQGVRCVVSGLGGGLSGTRVIRLRVTDSQGVQVHDAVANLPHPRMFDGKTIVTTITLPGWPLPLHRENLPRWNSVHTRWQAFSLVSPPASTSRPLMSPAMRPSGLKPSFAALKAPRRVGSTAFPRRGGQSGRYGNVY